MRNKFLRWSFPVNQLPMGAAKATTTDRSRSVHEDFGSCVTGGGKGLGASCLRLLELLRLILEAGCSRVGLSISSGLISLEGSSLEEE